MAVGRDALNWGSVGSLDGLNQHMLLCDALVDVCVTAPDVISLRWKQASRLSISKPGMCSIMDPWVLSPQMDHQGRRLGVTEQENNKASQILAQDLVGEAGGVLGGSWALGLT